MGNGTEAVGEAEAARLKNDLDRALAAEKECERARNHAARLSGLNGRLRALLYEYAYTPTPLSYTKIHEILSEPPVETDDDSSRDEILAERDRWRARVKLLEGRIEDGIKKLRGQEG